MTVLSPERRRAAERFLPGTVRARLRNPQVRPHWVGTEDRFWFRRETPGGVVFTVVDAATGAQEPAFDHALVAGLLAEATGETVDPASLPVADLDLSGSALRLRLPDGSWLRLTAAGAPEAA